MSDATMTQVVPMSMPATAPTAAPVVMKHGGGNSFEYMVANLSELEVVAQDDTKLHRKVASAVKLRGEPLQPTPRFWGSLMARFGIAESSFKYHTHAEMFERIAEVEADDRLRVCVERNPKGHGRLLAVSAPGKPVVSYEQLLGILGSYGGEEVSYSNGVVTSTHTPRAGRNVFQVAGDEFAHRFQLEASVDGYGLPKIYLSLLRHVCSNGMVGYAKAFKSDLSLGKGNDDVGFSITRALDGFNNEEGFAALRQRVEMGAKSWASVGEVAKLHKLMLRLSARGVLELGTNPADDAVSLQRHYDDAIHQGRGRTAVVSEAGAEAEDEANRQLGSPIMRAFHGMTGDVAVLYGLANSDALSAKRQRTLPVACTVMDLINFTTELATHHAKAEASRQLQAMLGELLIGEYDLEASAETYPTFREFFMSTTKDASGKVIAAPIAV